MVNKVLKKIKFIITNLIRIIILLVICMGLGIFFAIGRRAGSPERFAEEYFTYYMTNDYDKMYEMIEDTGNNFITPEIFKNKCKGEKIYGTMKEFSIGSGVESENGNSITYVVTYYLDSSDEAKTYTITLKKQKERSYLFFDTWKVSMDRFLVKDLTATVPAGMKPRLDGKNLELYYLMSSDDKTKDYYRISSLLTGDHTLSVTTDAGETFSKTEYIKSDNSNIELTTDDFKMETMDSKNVRNHSVLMLKMIYQYAMDGVSDASVIMPEFYSGDDSQIIAKGVFESIKSATQKEDGSSLRTLNFTSIDAKIFEYQYPDKMMVAVTYGYDFSALSTASIMGGLDIYYDGQGMAMAVFAYEKIDGRWELTAADVPCVDYEQS